MKLIPLLLILIVPAFNTRSEEMELVGITLLSNCKMVIIATTNSQFSVTLGETVNSVTLMEMSQEQVVIKYHGELKKLRIHNSTSAGFYPVASEPKFKPPYAVEAVPTDVEWSILNSGD